MLLRVVSGLVRGRRAAARLQPKHANDNARTHEAIRALIAAGAFDQAETELRALLDAAPGDREAHRMLGGLLGSCGRLQEAQQQLARALQIDPACALAMGDMANVLRLQGLTAEAESSYRRALAVDPSLLTVRLNLASLLEERAPHESAELYLEAAHAHAHPLAVRAAITLLDRQGRAAEARQMCQHVLARFPEHREAHRGLGFLLLKRFYCAQAALSHFERALAADANDAEVLANRGIALQDLGRAQEAIASYDAALALEPDNLPARFHRALALLLRGEFSLAWDDYELRTRTEERPQRSFRTPAWDGNHLTGKLLVHAEQGLGDEIMFASCLNDTARVCGGLLVECSPKLEALFKRSFPFAEVYAGSSFDDPSKLDSLGAAATVPAGSLPRHFRRSRSSFPVHQGYLHADPIRARHYGHLLQRLGPGIKVGLSWRGGTALSRGPMRTLQPMQLEPILRVQGARFVNLQYDSHSEELASVRAALGVEVHEWPQSLGDYDETAALVAALDVVVSVCTAIVHLGGALGRPVWVMAPYSPEWRYGDRGESMAWYPSVRVFRQSAPGQWRGVLDQVAERLRAMAASVPH